MAELSNRDVAAVFDEMADLLRLRGGDPHRVRAFGRAARVIEGLPEPVGRLLRSGRLDDVPGVGEGTVHRVKQILRRGTCDDLQRLRAALPPGLREMMKVKGLGPRTIRMLHQRLRVSNVAELEAAARSGRLLGLPRFGVDTVHALLTEIEAWKGRQGKLPLPEALAIADGICAWMKGEPAVVHCVPGGSMRRMRALVGDLDVLAAAENPGAAVARFVAQPGARTILSQGAAEASVRLASGRQTDLWVFPPESWGAGLQSWSGAKEHVVAIRARASRMGLHLSEHGVFTKDRKRRLTSGRHEEEIYAAVGLPWIAPELREVQGEIEAAEAGRLPEIVTAEDLRGDLHTHTTWSDGKSTSRDMARAAIDLGYEYLAVTDHSPSLTIANGLDPARLAAQREELRRLEDELGSLHLLAGIEVDVHADGSLDLDAATLGRLDWVVASIHDHFDLDREAQTRRLVRAMETGLVDCVGHPTGRKLARRDPYPLDLERVLQTARKLGVAVEANGGPHRFDLDDVGCRAAREAGVVVAVDTDAHSTAELRRNRDYALAMARRGWLESRHVLNTRPVEAIHEHRRDRLRRFGVAVPARKPRKAPSPRPAAAASPMEATTGGDGLAAALALRPLPEETAERLRRYLESGDDAALEAALAAHGPNPLQAAFNLLLAAPAS